MFSTARPIPHPVLHTVIYPGAVPILYPAHFCAVFYFFLGITESCNIFYGEPSTTLCTTDTTLCCGDCCPMSTYCNLSMGVFCTISSTRDFCTVFLGIAESCNISYGVPCPFSFFFFYCFVYCTLIFPTVSPVLHPILYTLHYSLAILVLCPVFMYFIKGRLLYCLCNLFVVKSCNAPYVEPSSTSCTALHSIQWRFLSYA